jgi:hypothetical protein
MAATPHPMRPGQGNRRFQHAEIQDHEFQIGLEMIAAYMAVAAAMVLSVDSRAARRSPDFSLARSAVWGCAPLTVAVAALLKAQPHRGH